MTSNRRGETGAIPFRTGRIFSVNDAWFFAVREGADLGPYPNKQEAEAALIEFLRQRATSDQDIT